MKKEIFRILDANLNRSREGLRVCEDITRFILNSPSLTSELKSIRHRITGVAKSLNAGSGILYESRDAKEDVGRCSGTKREMKRTGARDIFGANMERVKESLRVLEEFAKLIDIKSSARFSALRFRVYDIEKKASRKLGGLRIA